MTSSRLALFFLLGEVRPSFSNRLPLGYPVYWRDGSPPTSFRDRSIDIDLLTLFYQPKAHLPCGLICTGLPGSAMGGNMRWGRLGCRPPERLPGLSSWNSMFSLPHLGGADVHQFGSVWSLPGLECEKSPHVATICGAAGSPLRGRDGHTNRSGHHLPNMRINASCR